MYEPTVYEKRCMCDDITAMSWNVQGEIGISDGRLQRQLDFLETHAMDVDLFLFQAVNYKFGEQGRMGGQLGALCEHFSARDFHLVHTGDWAQELAESTVQPHTSINGAHNRCNLVASRWPIERRPLKLRNRGIENHVDSITTTHISPRRCWLSN